MKDTNNVFIVFVPFPITRHTVIEKMTSSSEEILQNSQIIRERWKIVSFPFD